MTAIWHKTKGYIAGAVAFVACPCHLPITIPLLLALTAGTAFGTWLENNTLAVVIISTGLFIGGIVLAFKWIGQDGRPETGRNRVRPHRSGRQKAKIREARQALLARRSGPPQITLLTSSNCTSCQSAQAVWQQVREQVDFQFDAVDITSVRGRNLAARHNIFSTPATIVDEQVVIPGSLDLEDVLSIVHPQQAAEAVAKPA